MTRPLILVLIVACGGSPPPPPTTPAPTDPIPMTEPVTAESAPDPTPPPTEPAPPDPAAIKAALLATETAAFEQAKPVFEKHCARCHAKDGKATSQKKRDHFDMTTYPFGGHHAMEIASSIRKSLGIGGGKPTMPYDKKGSVQGDELALIAAWADAFEASHAGGAHTHHGGGHDH